MTNMSPKIFFNHPLLLIVKQVAKVGSQKRYVMIYGFHQVSHMSAKVQHFKRKFFGWSVLFENYKEMKYSKDYVR